MAGKSAAILVKILDKDLKPEDFLPINQIDIGLETSKTLRQLKADGKNEAVYQSTWRDIKKFMEKCAGYLANKLPLSNVLLKNLACLSPLLRTEPSSLQMIGAVVASLPYCNSSETSDRVLREWRSYQEAEVPEDFYIEAKGQNSDGTAYVKYKRLDSYWHRIIQMTDHHGEPKYQTLATVVKLALSISHGQADVERGFSVNKMILTDRTSLSEKVLCATRTVKDVVEAYDSVTSIPMTPTLFTAYRSAHRLYKEAQEKESSRKREESVLGKRKQPIDDEKSIMLAKKREWEEKQVQAEKLINEGTERLSLSLKANNLGDIMAAHALLESGNKLLQECRSQLHMLNEKMTAGQHQPSKTTRPSTSKD